MADGELLEELTEEDSTYDAYEKDIAVLNLFYGDPEFAGNSFFWFLHSPLLLSMYGIASEHNFDLIRT